MENTAMESAASESTQTASETQPSEQNPNNEVQTEEEMLEIALGSVKGKVPKSMANAIKEMERSSREKFKESSEVKKQMKQAFESIKSNPREALKQLGIDPYEFAEMTLQEKMEELQKSPEQREIEELRKYKNSQEELSKKQQEEMQKLEMTRQEQMMVQSLDQEISKAFASSGLPKRPMFVKMIASEMRGSALRGEGLTAQEACEKIKADIKGDYQGMSDELTVEALVEFLGEKNLKKLREYEVRRVTGNSASNSLNSQNQNRAKSFDSQPSRKKSEQPMNERQWREYQASLKD